MYWFYNDNMCVRVSYMYLTSPLEAEKIFRFLMLRVFFSRKRNHSSYLVNTLSGKSKKFSVEILSKYMGKQTEFLRKINFKNINLFFRYNKKIYNYLGLTF